MTLAEKLSEFYHAYDPIHKGEDHAASTRFMQYLLDQNRILICYDDHSNIIGFVESWRLDYDQFGRTICSAGYPSDFFTWDITSGPICYLANIVIHPDYRFKYVIHYLKTEFFRNNYACEFFVGQAYRKRHQPLKVFTRQEFYKKYSKVDIKEAVHG